MFSGDTNVGQLPHDNTHPQIIHIEVMIGKPCCGGPRFDSSELRYDNDLSEQNEDKYVKAAEAAVRTVFAAARSHTRVTKILDSDGARGKPGSK